MKKIMFTLVLLVSFVFTTNAQGKYHERQNTFYVEEAAKEFDLNED